MLESKGQLRRRLVPLGHSTEDRADDIKTEKQKKSIFAAALRHVRYRRAHYPF
jgi:hypothetical protein